MDPNHVVGSTMSVCASENSPLPPLPPLPNGWQRSFTFTFTFTKGVVKVKATFTFTTFATFAFASKSNHQCTVHRARCTKQEEAHSKTGAHPLSSFRSWFFPNDSKTATDTRSSMSLEANNTSCMWSLEPPKGANSSLHATGGDGASVLLVRCSPQWS